MLLSALERQQKKIFYLALDISRPELVHNLRKLTETPGSWQYVDYCGLLGTYEDCVAWLPRYQDLGLPNSFTFLWLGSSIGNMKPGEASSLLGLLVAGCRESQIDCHFLVAGDGCREEDQICRTYDTKNEPLRSFILNGLEHANSVIGFEAFQSTAWSCVSRFYKSDGVLRVFYICQRDSTLNIDGKQMIFQKGDKIHAICSRKLTEREIIFISGEAGMELVKLWRDTSRDYSKPNPVTLLSS